MTRSNHAAQARSLVTAMFALICAVAQPANGDVILDFYGTSFRTYQATAKTAIQDVRPLFDQRGVNLDGSLRSPSVLPIAMPGNAFGES